MGKKRVWARGLRLTVAPAAPGPRRVAQGARGPLARWATGRPAARNHGASAPGELVDAPVRRRVNALLPEVNGPDREVAVHCGLQLLCTCFMTRSRIYCRATARCGA
jgi:hypothetical protein